MVKIKAPTIRRILPIRNPRTHAVLVLSILQNYSEIDLSMK